MALKALGVGNEGDFTYAIFRKDAAFFKSFSDLTKKAFGYSCYAHEIEKTAKAGGMRPKKIEDYADRHEMCQEDSLKVRFDLFFGGERVFVVLHGSKKSRDRFMDALKL